MEKYVDVMTRTLELSESCVEALEHIKLRINEGVFEDTMRLMEDLVNAVYQIETSMQSFLDQLPLNGIEDKPTQLRSALEHVVSAYEQGNSGKALEIIQFNLFPSCKHWKAEIDKALHPFVLS
ncbi:hypothetical protein [Paenibacillus cremeus]|uniref:DUF8042 domain-containing protein n=1 Tax=Paenibacillus cremeus TaxID=2163881 RepID=A0A559K8G2_9BACL|nr:hypothetical protein [Paenibacillus cremeus]TVY08426.1 hypothetical protein FPZ49_18485 [Paenibacillus cremeus]